MLSALEPPPTAKARVALFTPFSPDIGGGAVQLKSLLPELREFTINWYYTAPTEAKSHRGHWLGPQLLGGRIIKDLVQSHALWLGKRSVRLDAVVAQMEADAYWVIGMNEGVLLGLRLAEAGKPLHLTIHDDPSALFARSARYRLLAHSMSRSFTKLLALSRSVDVTSAGMQNEYSRKYGVGSSVVFRYIPSLPHVAGHTFDKNHIRVGHIGNLYSDRELRQFLSGLCAYGREVGARVSLLNIGSSRAIERLAREQPQIVSCLGELPETQAITQLAQCDFMYCMYPGSRKYETFRRTSQPIKLTTYVQSQRPVFAHTPADSTLASAVDNYRIGEVCVTSDHDTIKRSIARILTGKFPREHFEAARTGLFGSQQVGHLRDALRALANG